MYSKISAVKTSECDSVAKIIKMAEDPQTGTLSEKSKRSITSRSKTNAADLQSRLQKLSVRVSKITKYIYNFFISLNAVRFLHSIA